jgi:hypothetical protein
MIINQLPVSAKVGLRYVLRLLFHKKYKIVANSATGEAREKIIRDLESLEF